MSPSETTMQDLLSAVTDAIIAEDGDVQRIISQYDVPQNDVANLVTLIRRLHRTLIGVQPSASFQRNLKQELLGAREWVIVSWVRHLPARVQIAALATVIIGFLLIARRRLIDDTTGDIEELTAT